MVDPRSGPFLFDTSAESWFARAGHPAGRAWLTAYFKHHEKHISVVTLIERIRGYSLLWRRAEQGGQERIESARISYIRNLGRVWSIDASVAIISAEMMAQLPEPPTPARRSHRLAESRQDRLARWRFDEIIAATALVGSIPLIHNNAADFEAVRSSIERSPERFPNVGPLELIRCASLI